MSHDGRELLFGVTKLFRGSGEVCTSLRLLIIQFIQSKAVSFMACEFYLNKAVTKTTS